MIELRALGSTSVSPLGVGTVSVSLMGGDREIGVRTLCSAFDAGITWVDTAAAYVPSSKVADVGHNEALVADAIDAWGGDPSTITVVSKGGHKRIGDGFGAADFEVCGRRDYLRDQCHASLRALRRETIDVYLLHWPDPETPIEESVAAMAELQAEGKVGHIGLSNVSVEQLEAASTTARIAAVQNHFAPGRTSSLPAVRWCEEHHAAFMAYSPLGGAGRAKRIGEKHPELAERAEALGVSVQRVALSWVLAQSEVMLAAVGASCPATIIDSAAAMRPGITPER